MSTGILSECVESGLSAPISIDEISDPLPLANNDFRNPLVSPIVVCEPNARLLVTPHNDRLGIKGRHDLFYSIFGAER
jgi:hypothetical protein